MLLRCPDIKLVAVEVVESMEWMANQILKMNNAISKATEIIKEIVDIKISFCNTLNFDRCSCCSN